MQLGQELRQAQFALGGDVLENLPKVPLDLDAGDDAADAHRPRHALIERRVGAGIGFNWSHVDHVVYLTFDYYDDNFEQSWRRTTRSYREKPPRLSLLIYRGTVEDKVLGILTRKMKLANLVDPTKPVYNLFDGK